MSNQVDLCTQTPPYAIEAEQSVLGALLIDNNALDRIGDLAPEHFYDPDHRLIFHEIRTQITAGEPADVISILTVLRTRVEDCAAYLNKLAMSAPSPANIRRHSDIVIDRSTKRFVALLGKEMMEAVNSVEPVDEILDRFASKIESLVHRNTQHAPQRMSEMLSNHMDIIQARMDGTIKPVQTGFRELDACLDGGLERGTLTIVAGRPSMGKTAFGLGIARNVAELGTSLFLSMEMSKNQVIDRIISALGNLPLSWLKHPTDDPKMWARMTRAEMRLQDMNLFTDDQTALNLLAIRSKARAIKRKYGLDLLVIDQLSFITGSSEENRAYAIGEYTRGLIQVAKELDIAVVLLCQLNRNLENRTDKRPIMADLAMSGSIEQDAANIIFLYRDVLYNPTTLDKDVCEVLVAKQRQGEPGTVGLTYIGEETRFANLPYPWKRKKEVSPPVSKRGFEADHMLGNGSDPKTAFQQV